MNLKFFSCRRRAQGGFSLIELIVAIGIFSAVALTISEVMTNVFISQGDLDRRAQVQHVLQTGLMKIYDDVNMAFQSDTTFQGRESAQITGFTGDRLSLNFSTMAHIHYVKNAADTDQVVVGYSLARNADGLDNLIRRETDYLPERLEEGGKSFVLIPNVKSFELAYFDANQKEWKEEWDTASVSSAGALPSQVRVKLTVRGEPLDDEGTEFREYERELLIPVELYNQKFSF